MGDQLQNCLEVANYQNVSHLIKSFQVPPIKFINPKAIKGCCQVFISNYGGGMVAGDDVQIDINCLPATKLFLGTQSHTKIYKCEQKQICSQKITGSVHADAMVVFLPDPLLPFAKSRFRQNQEWQVDGSGNLLLLDWIYAGRLSRNEVFAYSELFSELKIWRGNRLLILEKLASKPSLDNPFFAGRFGSYTLSVNIYAVGSKVNDLLQKVFLDSKLQSQAFEKAQECVATYSLCERDVGIVKIMSKSREAIWPCMQLLHEALAQPEILSFNPMARKY